MRKHLTPVLIMSIWKSQNCGKVQRFLMCDSINHFFLTTPFPVRTSQLGGWFFSYNPTPSSISFCPLFSLLVPATVPPSLKSNVIISSDYTCITSTYCSDTLTSRYSPSGILAPGSVPPSPILLLS